MPADFNFKLNRQGVRGKKGDKGDKGFSPNITIGDNTQESFTLVVQNEFGTFETPNLKEGLVPEDRNGTYVRLDRETGQQYYGEPDIATESTSGVIRLASQDEVNAGEEETKAVTPSTLASRIAPIETNVADLGTRTSTLETEMTAAESNITALQTQMSTAESDIDTLQTQVATNTNDITSLKESTSTLESNLTVIDSDLSTVESDITEINSNIAAIASNISTLETQIPTIATTAKAGTVKPDGTTITITGDGTISAVGGGGGAGDVTAAGNNVFTGSNTFQQAITLQASSSGQLLNLLDSDSTIIGMITAGNRGGLRFGTMSTAEPFLLSTASSAGNTVYFLNQASVHNGNGITITTTNTTDITIAAEVNQQDVDELGNELNTLSGTVTSLGSSVSTLEGSVSTLEESVSTLETQMPSIATTDTVGTVKPDGTTITITADGTISTAGGAGDVTAAGDNTFTGSNKFDELVTFQSQSLGFSEVARLGAKNMGGSVAPVVLHSVDDIFVGTINNDPSKVDQRTGSIYIASTGISYAIIKPSNKNTLDIQPNNGIQPKLRITTDGVGFVNRSGEYQQFATSADLTNLGALKYVVITAEDYTSLSTKDPDTLYRVTTDGVTTAVYMGEFQLGGGTVAPAAATATNSIISDNSAGFTSPTNSAASGDSDISTNISIEKVDEQNEQTE